MKFSVVTINLNCRSGLARTIASVNEQSHAFTEHVIIDGGSTDGSVELLQSLSSRLGKWRSGADTGISNAFNEGTRLASGDWVCYLNSGDVFFSADTLEQAAKAIAGTDTAPPRVYFGDFICATTDGRFLTRASADPDRFAWANMINHQSVFIPRDLALKEPYDERLDIAMDYDLWLRLFPKATFVHLGFPVAVFGTDGRSSNPGWAIHNLVQRRIIWHRYQRTRLGLRDLLSIFRKASLLRLGFAVRKVLGVSVISFLKRIGLRSNRGRYTRLET